MCKRKGVNRFDDCSLEVKGSGKAYVANKHETVHTLRREPLARLLSLLEKFTRFITSRIRA